MADNFQANPGTGGATFASDDISGTQFPRVKITVGADGVNDGDVALLNPLPVRVVPTGLDGVDIYSTIDLDEVKKQVKATQGTVFGLWWSNLASSSRFLKIFDAPSASVVVGTTVPKLTLALPGNSADDISGVFSIAAGLKFASGITIIATTGAAVNDAGAPDTNDVIVNVFYR